MVVRATKRLFGRLAPSTERTIGDLLRNERVGGALMLGATVAALVWANGPWGPSYHSLQAFVPFHETLRVGGGIHLNLSLAQWAADGVLAVFFFTVGLELKREIVAGELRKPATAIVPVVAAIGGMVVPALIYLAVNATSPGGVGTGWAVPTATDIAFALAVLSIVGRHLPNSLRAFLLTLAVVDDLLAIAVIAIFYSGGLDGWWLLPAAVTLGAVAYLTHRRVTSLWLLLPLAALTWLFVHESGIHATIAGVALGLVVPAVRRPGEKRSPAEHWEHTWGPLSAGVAVPVFAFFAAGVALDPSSLTSAVHDPASRGVALGLVLGKPIGILLATFLVARFTRASLSRGMSWWDVVGIATVGGIGFTVSLLIGDLAFDGDPTRVGHVKAAVLLGSVVSAAIGASMLAWRDRHHAGRAAARGESRD